MFSFLFNNCFNQIVYSMLVKLFVDIILHYYFDKTKYSQIKHVDLELIFSGNKYNDFKLVAGDN